MISKRIAVMEGDRILVVRILDDFVTSGPRQRTDFELLDVWWAFITPGSYESSRTMIFQSSLPKRRLSFF